MYDQLCYLFITLYIYNYILVIVILPLYNTVVLTLSVYALLCTGMFNYFCFYALNIHL